MHPDLSIIIINYRTPELVVGCLQTIYDQTKDILFEVILVDNASGDESQGIITASFPQIRWIQMDYNAGFARANNEGIRHSLADIVLLLNSDTLNENNAIGRCFRLFKNSSYIACGVQLLNPDRTPQISGNFFMKGGLNNLLPLPYVGRLLKSLGSLTKVKLPNVPHTDKITEVDWINGAFLMVKKEATRKVGLMDEDFFLYAEEAEWCSRLRRAGKLAIYGQCNVVHLQGETSNAAFGSAGKGYYNVYDQKGMQIMLSNFVRIRKQYGVGWFFFHLFAYTLSIPIYLIINLPVIVFTPKDTRKELSRMSGFSGNVLRLWRYVFLIIAGKPFFYKTL